MRTAAALRIVCIGLLQEGQRLVFGVAKGTRLATRGRRAWLDRNGGHRRSGDVMWLCCRRAACKPGAARALRITFAYYGLGTLSLRARRGATAQRERSEEHTSELQSHVNLVCRLLLEKKKKKK